MMKFFKIFSGLMIVLIFTLIAQAVESSALSDFDSQILATRQHMRSYCGLIQQVMKTNDEIAAEKAIKEIQQTGLLWEKLQKRYAKNPPPKYVADAQFAGRLKTFQTLFDAMADNVQAKNYPLAFHNCAYACGLFVKMHEENGLTYVSDRLFHLRKALKSAQALHSAGHSLAGKISGIQQMRDRVYLAPPPENDPTFRSALDQFSCNIDQLGQILLTNDKTSTDQRLNELVKQVNDIYALTFRN